MEDTTLLTPEREKSQQTYDNVHQEQVNITWFNRILEKIDNLQFYRLGVMGFILMVQGNVLAPATLLAILYFSQSGIQFLMVTILSFLVLVTNIAEKPTRVTIPVFLGSTFIHLLIIAINIF